MSAEGPYRRNISRTQRKGRPRTMGGYRTEQNKDHILIYTQTCWQGVHHLVTSPPGAEFSLLGAVAPVNLMLFVSIQIHEFLKEFLTLRDMSHRKNFDWSAIPWLRFEVSQFILFVLFQSMKLSKYASILSLRNHWMRFSFAFFALRLSHSYA